MKVARGLKLTVIGLAVLFIAGNAFGVEVNIGPADITLQTEAARKPADFRIASIRIHMPVLPAIMPRMR